MTTLLYDYFPSLIALAGLNLVALISPGPDFAVVIRNSLIYSRRTALLTALGIALGIFVHVSYIIFGLGVIIQENELLFQSVKCLGVGYLIYIGLKGLKAKKASLVMNPKHQARDISPLSALRSGFLTNALNPKCMLFFISLFSVVISAQTPTSVMLIGGGIISIETALWFGFVAFCLSGKRTREKFNAASHWIERITGGILMGLGAKLLLVV